MTLFAAGIALLAVLAIPQNNLAAQSQAMILGPEDQTKQITIAVWLNLRNKAALDALVQGMYDKSSPNYHHFLTMEHYKAQFAPTAQQVAVVRNFLTANNIRVISTDQNNHFVMAEASVGDAQKAFNVTINQAMINGEVRRVSSSKATIVGPASEFVAAVQGLSEIKYQPNVAFPKDPATGKPFAGVSLSSVGPNGIAFSSDCLRAPQSVSFVTTGNPGNFPKATYTGNRYGQNITRPAPNLPPCGYDAANLQQAYGLKPLYASGLDGSGQTIMIVDAFGSNTIVADANKFSALNKLPLLTSNNFAIFTPNGASETTCTATNGCIAGNWQFETTIDVEWSHSIAPGANIVLVLSKDDNTINLDIANLFAIENQFGNVLSNSFGLPEVVLVALDPAELTVENGISEIAAALGISQGISTGDAGDNLLFNAVNFGIPVTSAGFGGTSPFTTAVGGTSTFLNSQSDITMQTGWGNNLTRIANVTPNPPVVPPLFLGFNGGAGGGPSVVFAKPSFQKRLSGQFRQTPDISMDADPFTGVEIIVTPDSVPGHAQVVTVFGGTSVSVQLFGAFWAIANQAALNAGVGPLGQAAPLLYNLPAGAIRDVVAVSSPNNVTGVNQAPPSPPISLSAEALVEPELPTTKFFSAIYNSPFSTRWFVLSFGTDTSLSTGPGWDNVTGLGSPNGARFVNAVVREASQ
jgi:subtilase family serine protease